MKSLENSTVNIKIKLALLWASVMACYIYCDYFQLYVPGKTQGLLDGNNLLNTPVKLFLASLLLTVPALMISIPVFLKPKIARFLHIILGIFYTLLMLLIVISVAGDEWLSFYLFMALTESALTFIIVWHAWNWPKQSSQKLSK